MRFTNALTLAAGCAFVTVEAQDTYGLSVIAEALESDLASDITWWKDVFLAMQRDSTNADTDCQDAYDDAIELYTVLQPRLASMDEYVAGLQAKGQGSGTVYGKAIDDLEAYIELATAGTNVYNECKVEYFTQAAANIFKGIPGLVNQAINLFWRNQDPTLFEQLGEGLDIVGDDATRRSQTAGAMGELLVLLFAVEIPEAAEASTNY